MKSLQKKTDTDLHKLLKEKREEMRSFRFGTAGSKGKNPQAPQNTRKDIARILTTLNERAQS